MWHQDSLPTAQPKLIARRCRLTRDCPTAPSMSPREKPLTFSKACYVDNNSTAANYHGAGIRAQPFRTVTTGFSLRQAVA